MKLSKITAVMLLVIAFIGTARAQDVIATANNSWRGFYIGGNIGGGWSSTCDNWEPHLASNVVTVNPLIVNNTPPAFRYRACPSSDGTFIGGAQIGYNFQYDQWVWGFGLDYEAYDGKDVHQSNTYTGALPVLRGTYTFSGKNDPDGFLILGPRIGYAVDNWLPYFRFGGVFTSGSRHVDATFTPAAVPTHPIAGVPTQPIPIAVFQGGKDYDSSGYGVGFGIETAMVDHWSFRAEYTYVNLGKGDNSLTSCTGTSSTCAAFGNIKLDNTHNSFTANLFRVGINYKF
jgi:outer membrane immunogenic protein